MTGYKTTTKILSWLVMAIGHESYKPATLLSPVRVAPSWTRSLLIYIYYNIMLIRFYKTFFQSIPFPTQSVPFPFPPIRLVSTKTMSIL